jgi:hypothetical protein
VQREGRINLSRERRVSWGAIAEKGITRRRQRYTDCYLAIQVAGIIMQLLVGRAGSFGTMRLICERSSGRNR